MRMCVPSQPHQIVFTSDLEWMPKTSWIRNIASLFVGLTNMTLSLRLKSIGEFTAQSWGYTQVFHTKIEGSIGDCAVFEKCGLKDAWSTFANGCKPCACCDPWWRRYAYFSCCRRCSHPIITSNNVFVCLATWLCMIWIGRSYDQTQISHVRKALQIGTSSKLRCGLEYSAGCKRGTLRYLSKSKTTRHWNNAWHYNKTVRTDMENCRICLPSAPMARYSNRIQM